MKGDEKLIATMNSLLADELTAVNQYIVHAEMADNHGYKGLHDYLQKRAIDEMKHAEMHIGRILFLEGTPTVSKLKDITIGPDVEKQLVNDHSKEEDAIAAYNKAIDLAVEVKDNDTREMLESILKDETKHIDDIESYQDQIKQMGIQVFLSTQVEGD